MKLLIKDFLTDLHIMYINVKISFYQQISGKEIYENKHMKSSNGLLLPSWMGPILPHCFKAFYRAV